MLFRFLTLSIVPGFRWQLTYYIYSCNTLFSYKARWAQVHKDLFFISCFLIFSTSDISYQMCYCCQKLDFQWNLRIRPQMYESASNVQLSDWLRQISANQTAVHLRPICTFEAESVHLRPILTFEADFLYIWGRNNLCCHVICLSQ